MDTFTVSAPSALVLTNEVHSNIDVSEIQQPKFHGDNALKIVEENALYIFNNLNYIFAQYKIKPVLNINELREHIMAETKKQIEDINKRIDEILESKKPIGVKIKKIINILSELKKKDLEAISEIKRFIEHLLVESNIPPVVLGNMRLYLDIDEKLTEKLWDIKLRELQSLLKILPSRYPGRVKQVEKRKKALLEKTLKIEIYREIRPYERNTRLNACVILFYILLNCIDTLDDVHPINLQKILKKSKTLNIEVLNDLNEKLVESLHALIFKIAKYNETEPLLTMRLLSKYTLTFWATMVSTY